MSSTIASSLLTLLGVIIVAVFSYLGVRLQTKKSNTEFEQKMELALQRYDLKTEENKSITNIAIKELTREVREHNNFAKRMPVVEEQIKVINHRLDDLKK